ncbi:GMC family oxidoreductase [Phaeobacter sp. 22II1-1F12B]|uniref:GMC family oxidoreductase n=1 Tax=Phaeobacter sp. 22II1-1F12B TaxID=1317111 RepID=UPI000B5253AB|nr:GMC family oxidoreductase N-terminal domain-containing protein [Phaeobacter sp. 22II1-1F12B]OWU79125.1 choline dehydrogenase [Phaeobacter sp. 22II1-1F12B]
MQGATADYIIIGAGSAGCVLANRLSADARNKVAVLEAGGSDLNFWVRMPIGYGGAFYHPRLNWRYQSEMDAETGRAHYWPRGKVVGGSSSINAMVFIRGQKEDYDGWASMGNAGWSHGDLLPYFKKLENNLAGADEWRGTGGPITVSRIDDGVHPLSHDYVKSAVAAGWPANPDFNGATQEGVGLYQINTRNGFRCSAATGYLNPAMNRSNLELHKNAQVMRLIFEGRRAVGVEYRQGDAVKRMMAKREVILSAGAVNSPQILQLSGIGDGAMLRDKGIEVLHDAPEVGRNLQDHIGWDLIYETTCPTLNNVLGPWMGRIRLGMTYAMTRKGPLSLSVNQGGGFIRTSPERDRPNLQLYFSPMSYTKATPGKRRLMSPDTFPGVLIGLSNCHPKSRGYIGLRSGDPMDTPEIHPGYLSAPEDLEELVDGVQILRDIMAQEPIASSVKREVLPGAEVTDRDALREDMRKRCGTIFHACGTCAMGPEDSAVVDDRLRVKGVEGLRVVDASIFPRITSGNLNAPVMMVGEKASDMILEDAKA